MTALRHTGLAPLWAVLLSSACLVVGDLDGDGYSVAEGDCDESDRHVYPGAEDTDPYDGKRMDCNAVEYDADGDGYRWDGAGGADCDDDDPSVHPGAGEICSGEDEDCDGLIDDADPNVVGRRVWYPDLDLDGFGGMPSPATHALVWRCANPDPTVFVSKGGDCDDSDSDANPGEVEVCGGGDDDCDGLIDDDDPGVVNQTTWYPDADGDGYGDTSAAVTACEPPSASHIAEGEDCDDSNAAVHPVAIEVCNEIDDDCDGLVDDEDLVAFGAGSLWFPDADNDDFTTDGAPIEACAEPDGYSAETTDLDCDDSDAGSYPGAPEEPYDGVDQDCDGADVVDADGDGFASAEVNGSDCDDQDPTIFVGSDVVLGDDAAGSCDWPWVQVSAGRIYTCALSSPGFVQCWGANDGGKAQPPAGAFKWITAGDSHACAVEENTGAAVCWGRDLYGESSPPPLSFTQVSAGENHSCGIDELKDVRCWGLNDLGQAPTYDGGDFVQVSAGAEHTCALDSAGMITCWGDASDDATQPVNDVPYIAVAAGVSHTCAVEELGGIRCWGSVDDPPEGTGFVDVSRGNVFGEVCAVQEDGEAICWGSGLADVPTGPFDTITSGLLHHCALESDGGLQCWGASFATEIYPPMPGLTHVGAGAYSICAVDTSGALQYLAPIWGEDPPPTGVFEEVDVGSAWACALDVDRQAECWSIGFESAESPQPPPDVRLLQLSVSWYDPETIYADTCACAVDDADTVHCWSNDDDLQQCHPAISEAIQVDVGSYSACAVQPDYTLACWGENVLGEAEPPDGEFVQTAVGVDHACAVATDGSLACWGNPSVVDTMPTEGTFSHVEAGWQYSCALDEPGALHCWGDLWPIDASLHSAPAGSFDQVSLGPEYACAVRSGFVECWGRLARSAPP